MPLRQHKPPTSAFMLAVLCASAFAATNCANDPNEPEDLDDLASDECRLDPENCDGGAGGWCSDDRDCTAPLLCCQDDMNCGGGMCTADCQDDRDCPVGMLCEHELCFYACDDDRDCAVDMTCEHDRTVCEYH